MNRTRLAVLLISLAILCPVTPVHANGQLLTILAKKKKKPAATAPKPDKPIVPKKKPALKPKIPPDAAR